MKPSAFLTELWGETPGAPLLVWTLPDRKSHWLDSPQEADQDWGERDVYTSVSLPHPDAETPAARRVSAAAAHAIPGLWADVDFTDEAHTKPGLPAEADALRVLMQDVETPTILVRSGHGFQAWWLFDEPWVFASDDERAQAQMLVRWWQTKLADALDAAMDSTHDLARVLRLPGTTNRKREPFVTVTAEVTGARRTRDSWTLEAVNARASDSGEAQGSFTPGSRHAAQTNGDTRGLVLTTDRRPDMDKLDLLKEAIPDVEARLKHQGLTGDQSLSGYDLSLASFAVQASWSDQEIVDLCIYHRHLHRGDKKVDRLDYWESTITKARDGAEFQETQKLEGIGGLGIQRVLAIRDPDHPAAPTYRLITKHGELALPNVTHITGQQRWRDACLVQCQKYPKQMKGPAYDHQVRLIMEAIEVIPPGHPDHPKHKSETDETREWVETYLQQAAPAPTVEEGESLGVPFVHGEKLCFRIHGLRQWLKVARDERLQEQAIAARLRDIGAEEVRVRTATSRRRCWHLDTGETTR